MQSYAVSTHLGKLDTKNKCPIKISISFSHFRKERSGMIWLSNQFHPTSGNTL